MENLMQEKFEKMGARVKVKKLGWPEVNPPRWSRPDRPISIDIRRDDRGEFFDVRHRSDVSIEVIDVKRADRHLLLLARESDARGRENKSKFLCGHDERAWFVAAIPETANAR